MTNSVSFVATAATATGQAASTSTPSDANASNNNGSAAAANLATATTPTGAAGRAAPCATAGKDGSLTITTNPNAYYPSTASQTLAPSATTIVVGAATGAATSIAPGDLLLVIQMQGADFDATNTDSYGDGRVGGSATGSSVTTNFTAGTYEYVKVATSSATVTATAGGTITLATGLVNGYLNAPATTTTGQRTFQVVRIPQYANLTLGATISPLPWNGSTGGIIALDVAGQLNLGAFTLDASGTGFRGGAGRVLQGIAAATGFANTDYRTSAAQPVNDTKGEGTAGTPRYVNNNGALLDTQTSPNGLPTTLSDGYPNGDNGRGAPGTAGGGGSDGDPSKNQYNTGGGGGANGGRGGRGGDAYSKKQVVGGEPGAAFPAATSSRLVLGGGGGAGTTNNGTGDAANDGFTSSGAAGGGMVLVRTGSISGTGSILANGANANSNTKQDGGGGGGAGGSILLTAVTTTGLANVTLTANGGTGGNTDPTGANATAHGPGGGGGGGVMLTNGPVAAASSVAAGANGLSKTSATTAIPYGAEAGTVGVANAGISTSIANSISGATCRPLPVVLTAFTASPVANRDVALNWTTASEANSAFFEVERSFDGVSFLKVSALAAKGSSSVSSTYGLTDVNVAVQTVGPVYYRLKQVDLDGTSSYSPVRTVTFSRAVTRTLSLYPNPTQAGTILDTSQLPATGSYQLALLDMTGRNVRTLQVAGGQLPFLDLHDLAPGMYQVLVTGSLANGDTLHQVLRLTKE